MGKPDYSALLEKEYDWERGVYGNVSKILPTDVVSIQLGKPVTLTQYYDTNLYHDMVTGCSVMETLHLFNQTPTDWQATPRNK
jgi:hypothetical protein